ncbi:ATP-binding protein [Alicyclobacillus cycloheptanicus]|nr:ATP-binding protein [Alicyclobacillus cycloheptanicus]
MEQVGTTVHTLVAKARVSPPAPTSSRGSSTKTYKCAKCRDVGWLAVLDDGRVFPFGALETVGETPPARKCDCQDEAQRHQLMTTSQISPKFRRKSFNNFYVKGRPKAVQIAYQVARKYAEDFLFRRHEDKNSLALLGVSGSGKTHLLMAVANQLMAEGVSVLYWPWVEGKGDLKGERNLIEAKLRQMRGVDVLFIDDLLKGTAEPTPFEFDSVFGIINFRVQNGLPMLISSELDLDTIRKFDNALGRRIAEVCTVAQIALYSGETGVLDYTLASRR